MYIAYIVVKRKKPTGTHSVEYVVYICNAHGNIKLIAFPYFWGEVYILGERDIIGTLHFSHPCHITIMTLLAPNYDINMTSFPHHMLGWVGIREYMISSLIYMYIDSPTSQIKGIDH